MTQVFISYSRSDKEFVRRLVAALVAEKRQVWLDETNIEPTTEWLKEIFKNIEAADNFLFVISPDSVVSNYARKEIDHAALNHKRIVPIFYQPVPDKDVPEAVARFQRIDFSASEAFDAKFAELITALDIDLDWKQAGTRLLIRAKEWETGKDSSFLLRGSDLREAEKWLARSDEKQPKPTTLHSQYIVASRQFAAKTQRMIIGAVTVAFLIAAGLAIYAFREKNVAQRNARQSKARELAALSKESLGEDPERSVVLGMHAVNATLQFGELPLPAAEDALHQAILSSQVRVTLKVHSGAVNSVAWSPDGRWLATAAGNHYGRSEDRTAKVWDMASGRELHTLRGHTESVLSVAWSPDSKRLATAGGDKTAKVWDAASGQELLTLKNDKRWVSSVAWSPDGKRLASGGGEVSDTTGLVPGLKTGRVTGTVTGTVWDAASGRELHTLRGHNESVSSVAWSPDGTRLATASADFTAKVWEVDSGRELQTLEGHAGNVSSVAWSADGKRLATGSEDVTAKVWDETSGRELLTKRAFSGPLSSVAWSPDGKRLATGSWDRAARLWDAGGGQELLTLKGHAQDVKSVAWSPDGKRLATASADKTAKVWDAASGQELLTLKGHTQDVNTVAWSTDGKRLATGSGGGDPYGVKFDPMAKVWDPTSGRDLLTLKSHTHIVSSVAWSPDGKWLATGSEDARVWDSTSGQELLTLSGHSGIVLSVAWSPDGKRLATASDDKTARVWDAAGGRELLTLRGHSGHVLAVAWSPDGKRLATGSGDGTVQAYAIDIPDLLKLARSRITRSLFPEECQRYFQSETCPPLP